MGREHEHWMILVKYSLAPLKILNRSPGVARPWGPNWRRGRLLPSRAGVSLSDLLTLPNPNSALGDGYIGMCILSGFLRRSAVFYLSIFSGINIQACYENIEVCKYSLRRLLLSSVSVDAENTVSQIPNDEGLGRTTFEAKLISCYGRASDQKT